MTTIVGRLHGVLDLDSAGFDAGLAKAGISLQGFVDKIKAIESAVRNVAVGMTAGLTVPLTAVGYVSARTAGDFEASMNRVKSALYGIRPDQLETLKQAALDLGPAVGKSAIEAADGIEMLAKNGLSASQIMGGALEQSLKLSALAFADLGKSADLVTDIMAQFHKDSGDLPGVVDRIAGALNVSKFGFDDYAGAIAQVGGVAGGLGVAFEDMNVALAATSSQFSSGSDAGTSFKTFLLRLTPDSKEATRMIEGLGLSFFDAQGNMRSMGEIAEQLRTKLAGLSDEGRTNALKTIFGDDAIRTAISLMAQGKAGLDAMRAGIDQVSAAEQVATAHQGYNASLKDRATAFERLRIAIAEGGLLQVLTMVNRAMAGVATALSSMPQPVYVVLSAFAAVTAALGPLTLAALALAKVVVPLLLLKMTGLGFALGALLNPIGLIVAALGNLIISLGAGRLAAIAFGTALRVAAGPVGLLVTALTALYFWQTRTTEASEAARAAQDKASDGLMRQRQLTDQLAVATGNLRQELLAKAAVERNIAIKDMREAQQGVAEARRALEAAKNPVQSGASVARFGYLPQSVDKTAVAQAENELRLRAKTLGTSAARVDALTVAIKAPAPVSMALPTAGGADTAKSGSGGAKAAASVESDYLQRLRSIVAQNLSAQSAMATSAEQRAELQHRMLNDDMRAEREAINGSKEYSHAQKARLIEELSFLEQQERRRIEADKADRLIDEEIAVLQDALRAQQDSLRAREQLATTDAERGRLQLRILDIDVEMERLSAQAVLDKQLTNDTERALAQKNLDILEQKKAEEQAVIARRNASPLERWRLSIPKTADEINDAYENIAANGLRNMNDALAEAASRTLKLKGFAGQLFNQLIADLMRFQIQQAMGGSGGFLGGLFNLAGSVLGLSSGASLGGVSAESMAWVDGRLSGIQSRNLTGFDIGGSFRVAGVPGIDMNMMSLNGVPVAKVGQGERVIVEPRRGMNDNGGSTVHVVPSPYFNVIVRRNAAGVAEPMARQAVEAGSASAQIAITRSGARQIP